MTPIAPTDEHERLLAHHTHPTEWTNPQPSGRYNLVVLGAGTAGLVCAAGAAGLGAKVALVEKHRLGGDCLHVGCVPSKALLRCARAAAEVRRANEFGVQTGPANVDFAAVMERMRRLRAEISPHDSVQRFREFGVEVYLGEGRFTSPYSLDVDGRRLDFARAVIATGSRPTELAVPGLEPGDYLTNETVFNLSELPRRLVVIGGGPIGCELAQAIARFGSQVHLIHRSGSILPREEPEASAVLRRQFERDGVHLYLNSHLTRIENTEGAKRFTLEQSGKTQVVHADALLVAVGRKVNLSHLGLDVARVAFTAKGLTVNDFLQTNNPRIYAAGDVCGSYQFTHAADEMSRIVLRNALFFGRERVSRRVIPWCTYTEPEVARVGLSALQAHERGVAIETIRVPLTEVDRAVLDGDTDGFAVVHLRARSDHIVGATLVAPRAGELIGQITLAMTEGRGLSALSRTVQPYPTLADVWKKAGDAYQRSRLTPRIAGWMRAFLRWRR
jgi:pyruvate/2-oxoglutarate dehydrogenase complex dihydrolipoamide dehydrogenase (E3) component